MRRRLDALDKGVGKGGPRLQAIRDANRPATTKPDADAAEAAGEEV